jgi:hypothetical protein
MYFVTGLTRLCYTELRASMCKNDADLQAMDRIQGVEGHEPLPWDEQALSAPNRRMLGVFKNSVLSLLCRGPDERPSMEKFCETCDRVLAGTTSVAV